MASIADDEKPKGKRIFLNSVDSYQGRNLAKFLSQCVVGASLEDLDEEEEAESGDEGAIPAPKEGCYDIIGTLKDKSSPKPEGVKEILDYDTKEQLYEHMMECDVIVYDVTEDPDQIDEAVWAVSELHSDLEKIEKGKMFILVSSLMTWARSKPLDPDDPEIPFTEDDYRRRKPHPNFKEHISAEKTVMKMGKTNKSKLITYVVASGLTYGGGENIFHYLFKAAWHNAAELQCFGNGQNIVPTIHIRDLAGVIQNVADSRPKVRYMVAVDDSKHTLDEIVKCVSQALGTGKIKNITKEEALLCKDIEQADFDMLLVNLRLDAVYIKENMRIRWAAESGILENMNDIVKEYKETRKLLPLRSFISGPPASGKTAITKTLCEHYKLHHIKVKDVIDEAIDTLQKTAARVGMEEEEEEEDDGGAEEASATLQAIEESKEDGSNRIGDQHVIRFVRQKLQSKPCQNQGFILDGFPKTLEQAKELFAAGDDEGEAEEEEKGSFDKGTMPDTVVCLEADDVFLKARIMNLPENIVTGTHNTEEGLNRRLAEYRVNNGEDETVLIFFDENEVYPDKLDITKDTSDNKETIEKIKKLMGEPRNYGMTPEEKEEERRKEEEDKVKRETEEAAEKERREAEEAAERKAREDEWASKLEEVKREEYETLETQAIPLRNYLMKHVMPTLTQGLIDCCKVRPDDGIDYLAEYLFKHNPQVMD